MVLLELRFLGHRLYYQLTARALYWAHAPGQVVPVRSADEVAAIAERAPYDEPRPASVPPANAPVKLRPIG